MGRHSEILPDVKMERSHKIYVDGGSQDTSGMKSSNMETKNKQVLPIQTDKQKNRVRAFTGAFVVMISPVLLGIVLKKVNLAGAGKYEGIHMLEVFVNFVQGSFSHLAAATLQIGILPFLCVMITEVCASYIPPRLLLSASKVLVFVSNIFLMVLGCGILLLIHKKVWLVLSLCSIMVIGVIFMHIFLFRCHVNVEGTEDDKEYRSKLEGLLELSAGITVMMFLVLECVALEGLLRNSKGQAGCLSQPQAPAPALSEGGPTAEGQEEFLGATLIISFVTSAIGVFLMNVWTTPHVISTSVVLTTASLRGLNFSLQALPIALVVILITVDVLPQGWKYEVVWLPVFPPSLLFLVWLARLSLLPQQQTDQRQAGGGSATRSTSSNPGEQQPPKEPEDQKPAPLELTKVAFTGFLVVAVPSISNASVSTPSILFVLFTATAVLFGLLWRLLTHEAKPSETDLEAANYASFFAHTFVFLAGGAFWVMAANVPM